jgi:hypothetical protein
VFALSRVAIVVLMLSKQYRSGTAVGHTTILPSLMNAISQFPIFQYGTPIRQWLGEMKRKANQNDD